jgi:excisionase family DNA binding protein
MSDPKLLTATQAAARMGLGLDALRKRVSRGRGEAPDCVRCGRAMIFHADAVDAWIKFNTLGAR